MMMNQSLSCYSHNVRGGGGGGEAEVRRDRHAENLAAY